ncbi:hypothetical protein DCC84_22260 [Pseudomonas sp. SXM-1]|nr:hypothetical protein DCC84_22260 [Pseudomonas sp. SXM-1]
MTVAPVRVQQRTQQAAGEEREIHWYQGNLVVQASLSSNVGAGLLAKAACQSIHPVTEPPLSRASPLPHF